MKRSHHITHLPRLGFTLIELLIVIAIIGLLAAILTVAVQGAIRSARAAAVKTEINGLQTALDAFEAKYGTYPPSAIVLCEDPTAWAGTSPASLTELQRIWPQFSPTVLDLDGNGTPGEATDGIDFNGDGDITDVIELDGAECLAFFLGGVMATDVAAPSSTVANGTVGTPGPPSTWGGLGFSKNPTNPFARSAQARIGPFFEFDAARLKDVRDSDVFTAAPAAAADGMPSVLDAYPDQQTPYAYLRATPLGSYPAATDPGPPVPNVTTACPMDNDGASLTLAYSDEASLPLNKKSFQLISPGQDGVFGIGGSYSSENGTGGVAVRSKEVDNIANFSSGVFGQ